jgi:hypothetical protein
MEPGFYAVRQARDGIGRNRPFHTSTHDASHQFLPFVVFATLVALDHLGERNFQAFTGRESATAFFALAPTPNFTALAPDTGIDHARRMVAA